MRRGDRVGVLVNSPFKSIGASVNPDVVLAVMEKCLEGGAKEIRYLKDPHRGYWERSPRSGDFASVLKSVKYESGDHVKVEIPGGVALKDARVTKDLWECDVFINISITKHHEGVHYSGALKNMMGLCPFSTNSYFHWGTLKLGWFADVDHLSQCIADLNLDQETGPLHLGCHDLYHGKRALWPGQTRRRRYGRGLDRSRQPRCLLLQVSGPSTRGCSDDPQGFRSRPGRNETRKTQNQDPFRFKPMESRIPNRKRTLCLVMLSILLSWSIALFPVSSQSEEPRPKEPLLRLLPLESDLKGWMLDGEPQIAEGIGLFELINGGAEEYVKAGFSRAVMATYRNNEGKRINVEIYEMLSPESARSIYRKKAGDKGKRVYCRRRGGLGRLLPELPKRGLPGHVVRI